MSREVRTESGPAVSPGARDGAAQPRPPRPWLAALLSILQPGLGHLYLWRPAMALAALGAWILVVVAAFSLFLRVPGPIPIVILASAGTIASVGVAWHAWRLAHSRPLRPRPSRLVLVATLVSFYVVMFLFHGAAFDWTKANVAQAFRIPSGAMEPTILPGDFLFVIPRRGAPLERDRLATIRREGQSFLYRIVGLPGDTLAMRDGRLLRNGRVVSEPYATPDSERLEPSTDFDWQRDVLVAARASSSYKASVDEWGPLLVPRASVFVLGDNRHNALDSRYTGFVAADSVLGTPASVYFSLDPEAKRIRWERIGRRLE